MNRILGSLASILVVLCFIAMFNTASFTWSWFFLLFWTLALAGWVSSGWKKIDLGSKGLLLLLGQRTDLKLDEGWRWAPFPFGIEPINVKEMFLELEPLVATTGDNVPVTIEATVAYRQKHLAKQFDVQDLKKGLEEARSQAIRIHVKNLDLEEVLKMHEELGKKTKEALFERGDDRWGIEIMEVFVPKISPDLQVANDLALRERENLQKKGQEVEIQHFVNQVNKLMAKPPAGPGLSREQAIEQVQLALGKATKNIDAKTIALDSTSAELVARILGRK